MNGYEVIREAIKNGGMKKVLRILPDNTSTKAEILADALIVASHLESRHQLKKRRAFQLFEAIEDIGEYFAFFKTLRLILSMWHDAEAPALTEPEESLLLSAHPEFSRIGAKYDEDIVLSIQNLGASSLLLFLRYVEVINVLRLGYVPPILKRIYLLEVIPREVLFSAVISGVEIRTLEDRVSGAALAQMMEEAIEIETDDEGDDPD